MRAKAPRPIRGTRVAGITALAFASVVLGLVIYVLLSNEPPNVVVPDVEVGQVR